MNVLFWGRCKFPISFSDRDMSRNVWNRLQGCFMIGMEILSNKMRSPSPDCFTRFYRDILHWSDITPIFDHVTDLDLMTFYLIAWGFHRAFATDAACLQRTLTPMDTCSCHTFGLACVLMLRPISPELVLFPDFWASTTPRFFCFALYAHLKNLKTSALWWYIFYVPISILKI